MNFQLRGINVGVTHNHNTIESIKNSESGYKLIAFSRVFNFPKCKPQVSPCIFADYKDGLLRIFNRNDYSTFNVNSFKEALILIRNFTDASFN